MAKRPHSHHRSRFRPPFKDRDKVERDLKQADTSLADLKQRTHHLTHEIDETQCALLLNRAQTRLAKVDREIAERQPKQQGSTTPQQATIERLDQRIKECKAELKQLADEKADLKSLISSQGKSGRVVKLLPQVEAMLLHEKSMLKEEDAVEQLRLNIESLQARVESERMQESHAAEPHRVATPHELARLDALAHRLNEVERQKEQSEQAVAVAESHESTARPSDTTGGTEPEEAVALHQAEEHLENLRQQFELDEQMHRLDHERNETAGRIQHLHQQQLMPVGLVLVLGVVFMVGVALIIWSLVMRGDDINWNQVMLGAAMAIGASGIKLVTDHEGGIRLQNERERLFHIDQQLEDLATNHAERGIDTETLVRQIEVAEKEVDQRRSHFQIEQTHAAISEPAAEFSSVSVNAARRQLEEARRRHGELTQDWRDLLRELHLAPNASPTQAREVLAERATRATDSPTVTDTETQLRMAQAELERRQSWNQSLGNQARQLVKELGHPPGEGLIEHFDLLRDAVAQHREHQQHRRELNRGLKRISQKAAQVRKAGQRYAAQKKQATEAARAKTEQARLQRQLTNDRIKLLEEQRELLQDDIREICRRHGIDAKSPLSDFSDDELEQRLESQLQKQASLQEKLVQQCEKRGQLRAELSKGRELPAAALTTAWAPIVDKTKELAERLSASRGSTQVAHPRQPHYYLHRAAEYLSTLSGGQFQSLLCPSEDVLILVDEDERSHSLDRVRREHYPNIYFSLWLARIEVYADRGVKLPVILEDPLKVTEPKRKKPLARLLKQLGARGHQTLLVTDVEAHADLFAAMHVPVADLAQREVVKEEAPESDWPSDYFEAPEVKPQQLSH